MINSIKMWNCDTKKAMKEFERYGEILQSVYFEIGVQIGVCLQSELLAKYDAKLEKVMTVEEFKDHLFDAINESDEILIRDIRVDEILGDIIVTVFDGSEFIIQCKRK